MAINRFTNLTPSAYNPLSMQEIMMTPMAMRAKHDQSAAQLEAQLMELDKSKALIEHMPENQEIKAMLKAKINAQVNDLMQQGFNQNTIQNTLKTNREIKELFLPTGRLGQMNAAYDTYYKELENFRKDNADKKWGEQQFKDNWLKHKNNYKGYDEKGNITFIDPLTAANKVETMEKLKDIKSLVGDSKLAVDIFNGNISQRTNPAGHLEIYNTKTGNVIEDNTGNIAQAMKILQNELADPNSDWQKSIRYSGEDINKVIEEMYSGAQSMIDQKIGTKNDTDLSIHGYKRADDKANEIGGAELLDVATQAADYDNTIGGAIQTINKYSKIPPKTMDEKVEYSQALEQKRLYDEVIKSPKNYINLSKGDATIGKYYAKQIGLKGDTAVTLDGVKNALNNANNKFLNKYKGTKYEKTVKALIENPDNFRTTLFNKYPGSLQLIDDYNSSTSKFQKVYNNYSNDIFKNHNTYSASYAPIFVGKEDSDAKSEWKQTKDVIKNSLSDIVLGTQNGAAVTRITTTDGKNVNIKGESALENREIISKVLTNIKDLEIESVSPNGNGVLPTVRFKVNLNENATTEDLKNISGSDNIGGENGSLFIDMAIDDFTSTKGATNIGTNSAPWHVFNIIQKYVNNPSSNILGAKATNNINKNKRK